MDMAVLETCENNKSRTIYCSGVTRNIHIWARAHCHDPIANNEHDSVINRWRLRGLNNAPAYNGERVISRLVWDATNHDG